MPELGEPQIRLLAFVGLFAVFAALELAFPRRRLVHSKSRRWFTNFTIVVIDTISLRIIPFGLAMGAAQWAQHNGYGLFNSLPMPFWLSAIFGFLVLDFAIWFSHWASHKVPVLWAIHRMHHTDVDIDVSTAIRFHPFEIFSVDGLQNPGRNSSGNSGRRCACFRDRSERCGDVQSLEYADSPEDRSVGALADRDARHAPGAPLHCTSGDRFKLRFQPSGLGSSVWYLRSATT